MDKKQTPPDTGNFHKENTVKALASKVDQCKEIIESSIVSFTINVSFIHDGKQQTHKFHFDQSTVIPIVPIKQFFLSYAEQLAETSFAIAVMDQSMIQIGNDVIATKDFLKDYSQGLYPSIYAEDHIKVRELQPGQTAVIKINGSIQSVKRIK